MLHGLLRRRLGTVAAANKHIREAITPETKQLHERVLSGDRYGLAKAITLVESSNATHRLQARGLMALTLGVLKQRAGPPTLRVGLSGPPGVGKSTFIEAFGMHLVGQGKRVAVLAVDPSSTRTGGSILGDKTRMAELTKNDLAYVRPSPSRGSLGGVARNTNEAICLCESAGYDVVLIETVGVGQSETMVSEMVDMFALLVPPAGGDELQGIKKGIMELADIVIVNKADGELIPAARRAKMEYTSALKFLRPKTEGWIPPVLSVSAVNNTGINDVWDSMAEFHQKESESGRLEQTRQQQRKLWMWRQVVDEVMDRLHANPSVKQIASQIDQAVAMGDLTPDAAADLILDVFEFGHTAN